MKPLIGIGTDLATVGHERNPRITLDVGYSDGILAAGGVPVAIPPFAREEVLEEYLERLDGLILSGGGDLNPRKLGKRPHHSIKPMHPRREDSDRLLCKLAIERKVPTLCIGVGMQLMNVMLGGSLYTHLPEDMPRGLPHFDPVDAAHRHIVFVTPGTKIEDIYGEGEIRVNSSHHQGVRTLGKGLRSGALSPDGLIEAYEATDKRWFLVGVQWHPESETASALDRQLFSRFIEAAAGRAEAEATVPALKIAA